MWTTRSQVAATPGSWVTRTKVVPVSRLILSHHLHDLVRAGRVEVAGGFVAEDDLGPVHQGSGDGHPLLLASGKLGGTMPLPVGESHLSEGALRRFAGFAPPLARVLSRQHDVLERREARHQVEGLEDEPDLAPPQLGQVAPSPACPPGARRARPRPSSGSRGSRGCEAAWTCPEPEGPMIPIISPSSYLERGSLEGIDEVVLAHDVALVDVDARFR